MDKRYLFCILFDICFYKRLFSTLFVESWGPLKKLYLALTYCNFQPSFMIMTFYLWSSEQLCLKMILFGCFLIHLCYENFFFQNKTFGLILSLFFFVILNSNSPKTKIFKIRICLTIKKWEVKERCWGDEKGGKWEVNHQYLVSLFECWHLF